MPSRPGFPDGTIAVWGYVILDRIVNPESLKLLAGEKNPKLGVLIDFIGDYAKSAKMICRYIAYQETLGLFGLQVTIPTVEAPLGFWR